MRITSMSLRRATGSAKCFVRLGTALAFLLAVAMPPLAPAATAPPLRGNIGIHDPSTVIKCKDRYYIFGSGRGIISKWSKDKVLWTTGPKVFASAPTWATNTVPAFDGNIWAPDIALINGRYCLYYSISSWGSQVSAIGVVTNPTLDPTDATYRWTDQGIIIQSTNGGAYNTIDPSVAKDANGNPWLVFGSYWTGIYIIQLDPLTGLRVAPDLPATRLAYNSSIEASCIYRHGSYYYLFANWGSCCVGVNSTYNIRVGRATSITGPYLDRNGVDMVNNGGSLFLEGTGKFTGPGHLAVLAENGAEWFSYHYYDAGAYAPWYGAFGQACFDLEPLSWTADNWPAFTNDWAASYKFQADARDEHGQYYGWVQGGAAITNDPARGRVLALSGTNQLVQLPPGVAYARTFAAVVKWGGGAAWQRLFDFGTDTSRYVMLTPADGAGRLTCHIKAGGAVQSLQAPSGLPVGVWTHVALTLDGRRGVLYVNGAAVATNNSMTLSPLDVLAQTNHLGRSKFSADPDFKGLLASFRAYGRVLSAVEIAAPLPAIAKPADGSSYSSGQTVSFSGSAADFTGLPLAASAFNWILKFINAGVTNTVLGPFSGLTNAAFTIPASGAAATNGCYRITLIVTDPAGRKATNSVEVFPTTSVAPAVDWASFYAFTTGAQDASNNFNGTLARGASIQTDATRGKVLSLAGGSQHVVLPAGVGTLRTFSGWVKWNGGAAWQRLFDFGQDTEHWFMLTPLDSDGKMQCSISPARSDFVQVIQATALPMNVWTHLAVTLDGRQGILYTNGQPAAINNSVNLLPADVAATKCYLGRSQYSADAYFSGQLDSVWLNSRSVPLEEILAPTPAILQPLPTALFAGGESLAFYGSATDYSDAPLSASAFTWTAEYLHEGRCDVVFGPLTGITNGSLTITTNGPVSTNISYRLTLLATSANGLQRAVSSDIQPRVSQVSLASVPDGLQLTLDSQPLTASGSLPLVAGMRRTLVALSPQTNGGTNYSFVLWSDGGALTHDITVPVGAATYTAAFVPPVIALANAGGAWQLQWPCWAGAMQPFCATSLVPPVTWSIVTNAATCAGGVRICAVPSVSGDRFYRLQFP